MNKNKEITAKKSKKIYYFITCLLVLAVLLRAYYRLTDDFRLSNITYNFPFNAQWEIAPLSSAEQKEVDSILGQKFTYLDKGAQSYAFKSEDDQYVIKFIKFKHIKPVAVLEYLPSFSFIEDYKNSTNARKSKKFNSVFNGYKLAYDVHKDETGLISIQLNPKQSEHEKNIVVFDKLGFKRTIDLNKVPYILQQKVTPFKKVLKEAFEKGDVAGAKRKINLILGLYMSEYSKGIHDRDNGVMHNTGFVGETPVHLDIGKLTRDPGAKERTVQMKYLRFVSAKMEEWTEREYPQYYSEIQSEMKNTFNQLFGPDYVFRDYREVLSVRLKHQ